MCMLVMSTYAHQERLEAGPKDIALFVQGFLKGAMGEDFGDLEACMCSFLYPPQPPL